MIGETSKLTLKFSETPRTLHPFDVLARIPKVLKCTVQSAGAQLRSCIALPEEVDMRDRKERLSLLWIFVLLNYLYADVIALFAIVDSPNLSDAPHLPPWALLGSAVLMEIPIAMIVASRLLPFRANRLANIITGTILTLINGFLTFVPPLVGARTPALPEYLFFATIETVCTSVIVWQAWTWSGVEAAVTPERIVRQPEAGIISS
jgi:hypothetical protein